MTDRRAFLRNVSLFTLAGLASHKMTASNSVSTLAGSEAVSSTVAKKQMGLQTYSLGQELLKDMPNGLNRLAKAGYTELEIFGYKEDSGKFGDYSKDNTTFIAPKEYKKMVDDSGMKITSSHLTPMLQDYTQANMPKFDEFWKKATDIHAELGVTCMVQPSLPRIENEDDAKIVSEIFNRAGEATKKAGILWGYHNHSKEFKHVLKAGEKPDPNPKPWEKPKGTYIQELFLKNTDPDKVMFELDVYWTVMGQQDPLEWLEKYPDRFKLLHIKDRWIIGASGMMNFPNIFKKGYENGIIGYYVELEGNDKGKTQFEGVEESAKFLQAASFVK